MRAAPLLLLALAACGPDGDGDGWPEGEDCDDGDAAVHPEAKERCNGVDDDCDGVADEDPADGERWYADRDGDGWGTGTDDLRACAPPEGYVEASGDCDDGDPEVGPHALEICGDATDQDCDGEAPECALEGVSDLASAARAFLVGTGSGAWTGESVAGAGDVNGDGLDDVVVGARFAATSRGETGEAYLLTRPLAGVVALSGADARLQGEAEGDFAGFSVAGAGDLDLDGYADLLVGAWRQGEEDAGAAYVVHGPLSGRIHLGEQGVALRGVRAEDFAGFSVDGAGDVDGDGYPDVVVGAHHVDLAGEDAGAAYLVRGPALDGMRLFDADVTFLGEAETDRAGRGVRGGGDADGDGLADLLVGAHGDDTTAEDAGATYLVLGPQPAGTVSLADAAAAKLVGEGPLHESGRSLAWAGDTDGDGYDDVLVGAWGDSAAAPQAGAAYLVHGPVEGLVALADADLKLTGERPADRAAISVGEAGDVDGDGLPDLVVGAWGVDAGDLADRGAVYLVRSPAAGTWTLADADAVLLGATAGERAGISARGAGDVDGDGYGDLLVGASKENTGGNEAGLVYLLMGGPP